MTLLSLFAWLIDRKAIELRFVRGMGGLWYATVWCDDSPRGITSAGTTGPAAVEALLPMVERPS